MNLVSSGMVDIVREYVDASERMRELFGQFRSGELEFDAVRELFADDERSPLFRLKERCHGLFRRRGADRAPMRRAALFDLAVGSLFHEAMKFRENFYQQVVYAPKVRALRESVEAGDVEDAELFREFDKIQSGSAARLAEALEETEALMAHTGEQLWALLSGTRDGLITRYLIEQGERIGRLYPAGLEALLEAMHGEAAEGYAAAAISYLDSAHFGRALGALEAAGDLAMVRPSLDRLTCYAKGMRSFLAGDYGESLEHLEAWLDAEPAPSEVAYASLAHSAISRIDHLVKEPALVERSELLARRIEPLVVAQAVRPGAGRVAGLERK